MKMPSNNLKNRQMNQILFSHRSYKIQVYGKGPSQIPTSQRNKMVSQLTALS
jgi:hypothetical protein